MANFLTQWNSLRKQNIKENRLFPIPIRTPWQCTNSCVSWLCKNSGKYVKRWSRNETLHWLHDDSRTSQDDSQIRLQSLCQCSKSDLVSVKPSTSKGNFYLYCFSPTCGNHAFYWLLLVDKFWARSVSTKNLKRKSFVILDSTGTEMARKLVTTALTSRLAMAGSFYVLRRGRESVQGLRRRFRTSQRYSRLHKKLVKFETQITGWEVWEGDNRRAAYCSNCNPEPPGAQTFPKNCMGRFGNRVNVKGMLC